jgi:phosphatidylglycerophosphate synthase
MFDGRLRTAIDPALNALARRLAKAGATPDAVTLTGFALALAAALAIALGALWAGLVLLLLSRLCDGLDGAVAKQTRASDFGGYLDIVLDFAFYGLIPLAFAALDPAANGLAAATLIFSFYVNGASFLAYATIAEKRGLQTAARGPKSFYFTTGLAEAGETLAVFAVFCLLPGWFAPVAYGFAAICLMTAFFRILQARRAFRS